IVSVRRSPGYEAQRRVVIRGEVTFPGNYSLTSKDETLSSFIRRAGGLTPTAFAKGAKMTRVRTRDEREQSTTTMDLATLHQRDSIPIASLSLGATYTVGIDLVSALQEPGCDCDLVLRTGM
ncbi:MAG: capsule biosynthesis protein, partial [Bacteroidales bacterium]|nr:capsule biosynthesis protein [Bacteroidales bacterium]